MHDDRMRRSMLSILKYGLILGMVCSGIYYVILNLEQVLDGVAPHYKESVKRAKNQDSQEVLNSKDQIEIPQHEQVIKLKPEKSAATPIESESYTNHDSLKKDEPSQKVETVINNEINAAVNKDDIKNIPKPKEALVSDIDNEDEKPQPAEKPAEAPTSKENNLKKEDATEPTEDGILNDIAPPPAVQDEKVPETVQTWSPWIHIAVVACKGDGTVDHVAQTVVLIKSALIMSNPSTGFHFHIYADDELHKEFRMKLAALEPFRIGRAVLAISSVTYPRVGNAKEWRTLFKPCATQRVFLPELVKGTNHMLYLDTDILFVSPPEEIWAHFEQFNATQLTALAPEHQDKNAGWYNRFARHPYYPPLGVNSGVMLMRLDMMREARWVDLMLEYFKKYKLMTTWGDQDLINIFFHFYPEKLYVYPCEWNYRPDHCMYMSNCKTAEKNGVKVVHGNRGVYHNEKQPAFKAVYQAFRDFDLSNGNLGELKSRIKENMRSASGTNCGRVGHLFTADLDKRLKNK